jgi:hypothetical protein|tara:strand:+ start:499 stop:882 length:384 start_codon:yes stop_codon:yes gene_type:complete
MKLYHGSPKKLKILTPKQAKGLTKFENQKAIFLCKTFKHAALYAIGKTLKGKTIFALTPKKLIIVGKKKLKSGYVYEVNVKTKKGEREQFSYNKKIKNFKISKVNPKDYEKYIIYVKDKIELNKKLK